MHPLEWLRRLVLLLRRNRATAELEEEMRLHRELRAESLRAGGASASDAQAMARRRFGNPLRHGEQSRDIWRLGSLDDLAQDIRYAARRLRQRPGFTLSVMTVLALGIGATTAMFSAVDAAILRPLPFPRSDELVTLPDVNIPFAAEPGHPARDLSKFITITDVIGMRQLFSNAAAYASGGLNLSDPERPLRVNAGVVSATFFSTLGVGAIAGRTFSAAEGMPGATHAVLLSYALWQGAFGGRSMIGQNVRLSDESYQVIGIMPPGFSFPAESQVWIPMSVPLTEATFRPFRGYIPSQVIARRAPGVSTTSAARQLLARWELAAVDHPEPGRRYPNVARMLNEVRKSGAAIPLQVTLVGDRRTALLVLLGATGLLLLIAGANVMNLQLSQAATRRREIAVREVLGATRSRVVRQLLAESVLLSVGGAVVGVALAPAALGTMRALLPAALNGVAPAEVNWRLLVFATVVAIVTGVGFGLWPALGTTQVSPGEAIKSGGGHGATSRRAHRVRRGLVVAELALTAILLVGAGLMLRSFQRLMTLKIGMDVEHVGSVELAIPGEAGRRTALIQGALARLNAAPGVQSAGIVNDLPLGGPSGIAIAVQVDGVTRPTDDEPRFARYLVASGGYFRTLGIPLLRGRTFTATDDSLAPPVVIVNAAMASEYWPGTDALGRTLRFPGLTAPVTVVGIVGDVREGALDQAPQPQMYFAAEAHPPANFALVARGSLPPAALLAQLNSAVHMTDRTQPVFHQRMMDEVVGQSVAPRRTNTLLIAAFAALALIVATLGVYAVVAHGMTQRSREFGIRAALGATGRDFVLSVSGEMASTTALGIAIGVGAAWELSRLVESLLFGVTAHDTATFIAVPVVLLVPVALATLIPARRVLRVNPAEVMRAE